MFAVWRYALTLFPIKLVAQARPQSACCVWLVVRVMHPVTRQAFSSHEDYIRFVPDEPLASLYHRIVKTLRMPPHTVLGLGKEFHRTIPSPMIHDALKRQSWRRLYRDLSEMLVWVTRSQGVADPGAGYLDEFAFTRLSKEPWGYEVHFGVFVPPPGTSSYFRHRKPLAEAGVLVALPSDI